VDLSGSRCGQVAGSCEHGNEHSYSIKCGKFLVEIRNCELLENECTTFSCQLTGPLVG
jgi:hypothetical protein